MGPGSYLAGFTFEKSGQPQEALRYYDEALQFGSYRTLTEPIRRLAAQASYRSPRIRKILGEAEPADGAQPATPSAPGVSPEQPPKDSTPAKTTPTDGELLVVVSFGRVPAKIAERIPIGLALTYVSGALSPHDMARANYLAAQGLVTWVNYPKLGKPRGQYDRPEFAVDGEWQSIEPAVAVDREAIKAWDQARGAVVASAITRMITRAVAGEAVRRGSGGGTLGALLSIGTQLTMEVADTPDTRSWATLPARMAFGRVRLPAGTHQVTLGARGLLRRYTVTLKPGGFAVLNLTVLS
jgi:hypothetical protein